MIRALSGVSKLPKPRSMEDLENSTKDDSFTSVIAPTSPQRSLSLGGSSFHKDCQSTLKKCRELLCAKRAVELRVLPEPNNTRACIIQLSLFKPRLKISGTGLATSQRRKFQNLHHQLGTMS